MDDGGLSLFLPTPDPLDFDDDIKIEPISVTAKTLEPLDLFDASSFDSVYGSDEGSSTMSPFSSTSDPFSDGYLPVEEDGNRQDEEAEKTNEIEIVEGVEEEAVHEVVCQEATVKQTNPLLFRRRQCSLVCWMVRLLLSSEFNSLPLSCIFDSFQDMNPQNAVGRHWRQSIRHCLHTSRAFVKVLTPDPRKDHLIMNEAGSWWSVHPSLHGAASAAAFTEGAGHRCPPSATFTLRIRSVGGERLVRVPPASHDKRVLSSPRGRVLPPVRRLAERPRHPLTATARNDEFVIDHEEVV